MMKTASLVLIVTLVCASVMGRPYEYSWKTPIAKIQKDHHLSPIDIEGLHYNLTNFLGQNEASKYKIYVVDKLRKQIHCDIGMFSFMMFYSDSLISLSLSTEEMPVPKSGAGDDKIGECLAKSLFGEDIPLGWRPIWKTTSQDGDIFWEGGLCGQGEAESDYLVSLCSMGTVTKPDHLQYTLFFFDKQLLDDVLQNKMKVHVDHKQRLHPTSLFVEYLVDKYRTLQKPVKE
ncbi:MAG: hypothetical protein GY865_11440 [candidate division Zixibacteria bacterium]|nr:hypothetical protein [candidate division Zixibacteria bacterium]